MTQIISLKTKDIPLKEGCKTIREADLDFRVVGHKVATACYVQGKSFHLCISINQDGVDWTGSRADYDLIVRSGNVESTRRISDWHGLGVTGGTKYHSILPQWFWATQVRSDDPMGMDRAIDLAEAIGAHRLAMRQHLDVLWSASTGIPERVNTPNADAVQAAALAWRQGGLWMCYDDSGMYAWDGHTLAEQNLDIPPAGHKLYPNWAILTGTFRNTNASVFQDESYLADCLKDVAAIKPVSAAEEYIVGDAVNYLQMLKTGAPSAFLNAVQMAHGQGQWQQENALTEFAGQTPQG